MLAAHPKFWHLEFILLLVSKLCDLWYHFLETRGNTYLPLCLAPGKWSFLMIINSISRILLNSKFGSSLSLFHFHNDFSACNCLPGSPKFFLWSTTLPLTPNLSGFPAFTLLVTSFFFFFFFPLLLKQHLLPMKCSGPFYSKSIVCLGLKENLKFQLSWLVHTCW